MAKIKSPNPQYTGVSASLQFVNGEAQTEDKWLIEWFQNKGYEVIEEVQESADQIEKDFSKLTKDEIKAKLTELEVEFSSSDNKDELLEKLKVATEKSE
jgi:hypothetical protein